MNARTYVFVARAEGRQTSGGRRRTAQLVDVGTPSTLGSDYGRYPMRAALDGPEENRSKNRKGERKRERGGRGGGGRHRDEHIHIHIHIHMPTLST